MRLKHRVSVLAVLATTAAVSAPSAYATWPAPDGGYTKAPVAAQPHPASPTDWELIGLGAAVGSVALAGAGVVTARRLSQSAGSATVTGRR